MIKKVILLALSLCLVLCAAGCGAEMPQPCSRCLAALSTTTLKNPRAYTECV
jgi:hypothetical protein